VHNITIYKLELYANTPYYSAEKHGEVALPDEAQELEFIQHALAELKRHDYHPVNAFTFTKGGGHDQLNTRNRWQGEDSYACGVSAYGSLGRWQYQNTNDIPAYTAAIARQELPVMRAYNCSSFDLIVREAVMGIKLVALDHQRFLDKHGIDLRQVCADDLSRLAGEGFITVDDREIRLTDRGIVFGDHVSRTLEASLKKLTGSRTASRTRVHV
jgi:oxygen-independent coproporphyrinogen-3 oxidase